jgi:hypothetical protein
VSSQWILALLSQDSLTDSLAGFTSWIRSLLTLDLLGEFSVDSPYDSLADSLAGFARWIRSLDSLATQAGFTLDFLGEFLVDSRAALPRFSC